MNSLRTCFSSNKKGKLVALVLMLTFAACSANKEGFLDTLPLGIITTDELSDMVKDKSEIQIDRYTNVEKDIEEIVEGEIVNPNCQCKIIEFIRITDPHIATYKGIKGHRVDLTAYDNKIVEYEMDISGVDNINKVLDVVYAEHPDIKLMNDGTIRLKKYIDKNTVLQVWVNDVLEDNIFVTVTYTSNASASRFWLYPNYDDKINENVNRVSIEKDVDGEYGVKLHYREE